MTLGRVLATLSVLAGVTVAVPLLAVLPAARTGGLVRMLAGGLLRSLGVDHRVVGTLPGRAALVVANHISWLDVLALLANAPIRLLAKREVRNWPLIGAAAAAVGTIFIDRTRPSRLPVAVAEVSAALRTGAVVAAFPEGTTWCGRGIGVFRPAVFQAAIDAGVPVVPVGVAYQVTTPEGGQVPTTLAAFVGEQTLLASLVRVITATDLTVVLTVARSLSPVSGDGRRRLAVRSSGTVDTTWLRRYSADRHRAHGRLTTDGAAQVFDTGVGGAQLSGHADDHDTALDEQPQLESQCGLFAQ